MVIKANASLKEVFLNTTTILLLLLALITIWIFWFPGYISFGAKVYGINVPRITTKSVITLLVVISVVMGATYKIIRNRRHFLIVLSFSIILGHIITILI